MKYLCPICGGTDLRVEIPVVAKLEQDGDLNMVDLLPNSMSDCVPSGQVACMNEECEFAGTEFLFHAQNTFNRAMALVRKIAQFTKEGEPDRFNSEKEVDWKNYEARETMMSTISEAREVLGTEPPDEPV